ncbi:hypothetical protein BSKO_01381 [Bryopsis sp. KO-2023]|nr:hypothetical protein BSKO_01381 [Bryopsis sp. KO-2023]
MSLHCLRRGLWGGVLCLLSLILLRAQEEPLFAELQEGWNDIYPVDPDQSAELRQEAWDMFDRGFTSYMQNGFPKDDLRPISCVGSNSQGGMALTLLDVLDTLIVMNRKEDVHRAIDLIKTHVSFDLNARVSMFEVTIRAIGGLVSAHMLVERNEDLAVGYDGVLLMKATELADRLLPGFDTASGIPYAWLNLQKGVSSKESDVACVAGAGTLILEFGALSRLTGESRFEVAAKRAMKALFQRRSYIGLMGNTIHTRTGKWARKDSGIGAGIDSFFEYMLKGYILLGDSDYLDMFLELYAAASRHMTVPGLIEGYQWMVDVHMDEGYITRPWISSLSAFWPGMQALIGQEEDARAMHANYSSVYLSFGGLPELFTIDGARRHPQETGYPLRPELIESTYLLHSATRDPHYLEVGRCFHKAVQSTGTGTCAYASVKDIATGEVEDAMESFFLSETAKYLYLLFSNDTRLVDFFVLSTEGHLFPPVPLSLDEPRPNVDSIPVNCVKLCQHLGVEEMIDAKLDLSGKFPLLEPNVEDMVAIRRRRCVACIATTTKLASLPKRNPRKQAKKMNLEWAMSTVGVGQCAAEPPEQQSSPSFERIGQIQCLFEFTLGGNAHCKEVHPLKALDESEYDALPVNSVVIALSRAKPMTRGRLLWFAAGMLYESSVVFGGFGPQLDDDVGDCLVEAMTDLWTAVGNIDDDYADYEEISLAPDVEPEQSCNDASDGSKGFCEYVDCSGKYVQGGLVVAEPLNACRDLQNPEEIKGGIVLVERGICPFSSKVKNAEDAGAVAVIVINDEGTDEVMTMSGDPNYAATIIPSAMISHDDGHHMMTLIREHTHPMGILSKSDLDSSFSSHSSVLKLQNLLPAKSGDDASIFQEGAHIEMIIPKQTQNFLSEHIPRPADVLKVFQSMFRTLMADSKALDILVKMEVDTP